MKYIEWIPPENCQVTVKECWALRFLKNVVTWVLTLIIPKANPDFEKGYENVRKWWLEVNDEGSVEREIGFDSGGKSIVIGPFKNNWGVLTDSSITFNKETNVIEIEDNFQKVWNTCTESFELKFRQ